jgi:nucleoside-diphosphate-sugar epimerase
MSCHPPCLKVCIVGPSGKLGKYMVQHALDRGYDVVAVCREQSVGKLAEFDERIEIVPGGVSPRRRRRCPRTPPGSRAVTTPTVLSISAGAAWH